MKICIDCRVIINKNTGIGIYTYNLLKYLLKIDQDNEYHALFNGGLNSSHPFHLLDQENLIKHSANIREVSLAQQLLVPLALRQFKPDLYHYPNFDLPVFNFYNSVFTVHDLTYIRHKSLYIGNRWLKNAYTKFIMRLAALKARKIIAVSHSTKSDLVDILKIPFNKIIVVYEAMSNDVSDENHNDGINVLNNYKIPASLSEYFFFMGERRPHKNLVRLIEGFALFKNKNKTNHKLIIGGKPYSDYNEPEKKVVELGLDNDVFFIGYVSESDVKYFYANATCFVLPSIYEGFGIPVLEAMACGTPVITSNISSMPEIAGNCAITINPYNAEEIGNAMSKMISDIKLRNRLIASGKKRVKDFSWEKTAKDTLQVYKDIYNS
ncbi:glycosyltransferase family 4 protein [candidate division KSB1 bacterium]|nr:glycosyltransferase family 4 protein [candidate division KSB1 bacterium]